MKLKQSLFFLSLLFILHSCIDPFSLSNSSESNTLAKQYLEDIAQLSTFDAQDSVFNFVSNENVTLTINPEILKLDGESVTGPIECKFIEIFDKGTMAITDIHTTGINSLGEQEMLISGGTFHVEFTSNGQELEMPTNTTYSLTYESKSPNGEISNMDLFRGTIIDDENLLWASSAFSDYTGVLENEVFNSYAIFTNFFGWINADYFYHDSRPKTDIAIQLSKKYTTKSRIYLSFDGLETGLASNYGNYPIGQAVHVIVVYEKNGQYEYSIEAVEIEKDLVVEFESTDFQSISIENLIDEINDLP